jgi:hypothetical protein
MQSDASALPTYTHSQLIVVDKSHLMMEGYKSEMQHWAAVAAATGLYSDSE